MSYSSDQQKEFAETVVSFVRSGTSSVPPVPAALSRQESVAVIGSFFDRLAAVPSLPLSLRLSLYNSLGKAASSPHIISLPEPSQLLLLRFLLSASARTQADTCPCSVLSHGALHCCAALQLSTARNVAETARMVTRTLCGGPQSEKDLNDLADVEGIRVDVLPLVFDSDDKGGVLAAILKESEGKQESGPLDLPLTESGSLLEAEMNEICNPTSSEVERRVVMTDIMDMKTEDPMETAFFRENRRLLVTSFGEIENFSQSATEIICGEDRKRAHELTAFLCSCCFKDYNNSVVVLPLFSAFCVLLEESDTRDKLISNKEQFDMIMNALNDNNDIEIKFVMCCLRLAKAAHFDDGLCCDWVPMILSDVQNAVSFFDNYSQFQKDKEKKQKIAKNMEVLSNCKRSVTIDIKNGTKIDVSKLTDMKCVKELIFNADLVNFLIALFSKTFTHKEKSSDDVKINKTDVVSLMLSSSGDSYCSDGEDPIRGLAKSMKALFDEEESEPEKIEKDASEPAQVKTDESANGNSTNFLLFLFSNLFSKCIFCKNETAEDSCLFSECFGKLNEDALSSSILEMAEFVSKNKNNSHVTRCWVDFVSAAADATKTLTTDFFSNTVTNVVFRLVGQDETEKDVVDKMSRELLFLLGRFWISLIVNKWTGVNALAKDVVCGLVIMPIINSLDTSDSMSDDSSDGCPFKVNIELIEMILFVLYSINDSEYRSSIASQLLQAIVSFSEKVSSASSISIDTAIHLSQILFMLEFLLTHKSVLPRSLTRGFRNQIIAHPVESLMSEDGLDFSLPGVAHFFVPSEGSRFDFFSWNKKLPFAASDMFQLPFPLEREEYSNAFSAISKLLTATVISPKGQNDSYMLSTAIQSCLVGFVSRIIPPRSFFSKNSYTQIASFVEQNPLYATVPIMWILYVLTKGSGISNFGIPYIPSESSVNVSKLACSLPSCINAIEKELCKCPPELIPRYISSAKAILLLAESLFPDYIAISMSQGSLYNVGVPRALSSMVSGDSGVNKALLSFAKSCHSLCNSIMGVFVKTTLSFVGMKNKSVLDALDSVDFITIANIATASKEPILSRLAAAFGVTEKGEQDKFVAAFSPLCKKHIEPKRQPVVDSKDIKEVFSNMVLFHQEDCSCDDFVVNEIHESAVLAARLFIDVVAVAIDKKGQTQTAQETLTEICRFIATYESCPVLDDLKLGECFANITESKKKKDSLEHETARQTVVELSRFIKNVTRFCSSEKEEATVRYESFTPFLLDAVSKLKQCLSENKKVRLDKEVSLEALLYLAFSSTCPDCSNAASEVVTSIICKKSPKSKSSGLIATEKDLCELCTKQTMEMFSPEIIGDALKHIFSFSTDDQILSKQHPFANTILLLFNLCTFSPEFCSFLFNVLFPAVPHFLSLSAKTHKRFLPFFMILEHSALGAGPKAFTTLFSFAVQCLVDITSTASMEEGRKEPTPAHSVLVRIAERLVIFVVHDPDSKDISSFSDMPELVSLKYSSADGSGDSAGSKKKTATSAARGKELEMLMKIIQGKNPFWRWANKGEVFHEESEFGTSHCTFVDAPPRKYQVQPYYRCFDCFKQGDVGCCSTCAAVCHSGHDLMYHVPANFFCDCAEGAGKEPCHCCKERSVMMERMLKLGKMYEERAAKERMEAEPEQKQEPEVVNSLDEAEEAELNSICPSLSQFNTYQWHLSNMNNGDSMEESVLVPDADKMADEFAKAIKPLFNALAETQEREFPSTDMAEKNSDVSSTVNASDPEGKKMRYAQKHFVEHSVVESERGRSRFLSVSGEYAGFHFNIYRIGSGEPVLRSILRERQDFRTPVCVLRDCVACASFHSLLFVPLETLHSSSRSSGNAERSGTEFGVDDVFHSLVSHPSIPNLFVGINLNVCRVFAADNFLDFSSIKSTYLNVDNLRSSGIQDFVLSVFWHPTEPILAAVTVQGSLLLFDVSSSAMEDSGDGSINPFLTVPIESVSGSRHDLKINTAFFVRAPGDDQDPEVSSRCRGAVVALMSDGHPITIRIPGRGSVAQMRRRNDPVAVRPVDLSCKGNTLDSFSVLPVSMIPGTSAVLVTTQQGMTYKVVAHLRSIENGEVEFDPTVLVYSRPKASHTLKYSPVLCGENLFNADENAALILSANPDDSSPCICAIAMDDKKAVSSEFVLPSCLQVVVLPPDSRSNSSEQGQKTVRALLVMKDGTVHPLEAIIPGKNVGSSSPLSSSSRIGGGGGDGHLVPAIVERYLEKKSNMQFPSTFMQHLHTYEGRISVEIPGFSSEKSREAEHRLSRGQYVVSERKEYLDMKISVSDPDFCVLGVCVIFGQASRSHIPKRISVDQHSRETDRTKPRGYDFKRTIPEVLAFPNTIHLVTSGCEDRSNPPVLDSVVFYGLRRSEIGLSPGQWPRQKKAEQLLAQYNNEHLLSQSSAAERRLKADKEKAAKNAKEVEEAACDAFGGSDGKWRLSETGVLSVILNHVLNGVRLYGQRRRNYEKQLEGILPQFLASPAVHRSPALRGYLEGFVSEVGVHGGLDREQSLWLSDRPALAYLVEGRQEGAGKGKPLFVAKHVASIVQEVCVKRPQNVIRFAQDMAQNGQGSFFAILARLCNEDSSVVNVVLDVFAKIVASAGKGTTDKGGETLKQVVEALILLLNSNKVSVRMTVSQKFPAFVAESVLKKDTSCITPRGKGHFNCDYCGVSPVEGVRWHCEECNNFDLCDVCHKKLVEGKISTSDMPGSHKASHQMTEIEDGVVVQCAGCQKAELQLVWWQCVECGKRFCPKCRASFAGNAHEPSGHLLRRCVYTEAKETQQLLLASLLAGFSTGVRGSDTTDDPAAEMAKQMSLETGYPVIGSLPNHSVLTFLSDDRSSEEMLFESFVTGLATRACEVAFKQEDPTKRLRYLLFAFKCLDKFSDKNRDAALNVTRADVPHILEAVGFVSQNVGKHPTSKLTSALVDMHYLSACFESEEEKHSTAMKEKEIIEKGAKKDKDEPSDSSLMEDEEPKEEKEMEFGGGMALTPEFVRNLYVSLKSLVPILKEGKVVPPEENQQQQDHEGGEDDMVDEHEEEEEEEEENDEGMTEIGTLLKRLKEESSKAQKKDYSKDVDSMLDDIADYDNDDVDDSEMMLWSPVLPVFSSTLPPIPANGASADFAYGVFAIGALLRLLVALRRDASSVPDSRSSACPEEGVLSSSLWRELVCQIIESEGLERSGLKTLVEQAAILVCGNEASYHLMLDSRRYCEHMKTLRAAYEGSDKLHGELAPAAEGRIMDALDAMSDLSKSRPAVWARYCATNPQDILLLFDFTLALVHGRVHGAVLLARTLSNLLSLAVCPDNSETACEAILKDRTGTSLEQFVAELCVLHADYAVRDNSSKAFVSLLMYSFEHNSPQLPQMRAAANCGLALLPSHSFQAQCFSNSLRVAMTLMSSKEEKPKDSPLDAGSLVGLLRRSNSILTAHADAPLYRSYRSLAGPDSANMTLALVGTHTCGECLARAAESIDAMEGAVGSGQKRRTESRMSGLCGKLAYTSRSVVGVLRSARILTSVRVEFSVRDESSRAPKQVSVYVTVRSAASAKDLITQRSIWTRVASATVEPNADRCVLSFAPADAACVMVEFTDLYDRKVAARIQCPRCGSVVAERHGVCSRCGENAFQCRGCRYIPYGDLDYYLCRQCGKSRDINYEIVIESEEGLVVPPVETEQDFDQAMRTLEITNEQAAKKAEDVKDLRRIAWH